MSFLRSVLPLVIITLLITFCLLYFGSIEEYEKFTGGYAILSADASIQENVLLEILEKNENDYLGTPVSQSSQWVLLDNFSFIERIPLDKYSQRVFPFDPRNDGYAQKLKDFFIINGKSVIYIPLLSSFWNPAFLDRQFKNMMDGIDYSIEYYGAVKPVYIYFIIYAASLTAFFIIFYFKNKINNKIVIFLPAVLPLSALSFFGISGIISAALIIYFFILMKEPLADLVKLPVFFSKSIVKILTQVKKEIFKPYRSYFPVIPVFIVLFTLIIYFSRINFLFFAAVFFASLFIYLYTLKKTVDLKNNRRRFNPVMIIKNRFPDFSSSVCIIPFAVFSIILLLFIPDMENKSKIESNILSGLSEIEYYEHIQYQETFSTRRLGTYSSAFFTYSYGEDGLPVQDEISKNQNIVKNDYPPFPLKEIVDFFSNNNEEFSDNIKKQDFLEEEISIITLAVLIISSFFIRIKKNDFDKNRFTGKNKNKANIRFKGINRNKSLLYNSRNDMLIRKDA